MSSCQHHACAPAEAAATAAAATAAAATARPCILFVVGEVDPSICDPSVRSYACVCASIVMLYMHGSGSGEKQGLLCCKACQGLLAAARLEN